MRTRLAAPLASFLTPQQLGAVAARDGWTLKWEGEDLLDPRAKAQIRACIRRVCEAGQLPSGDVEIGVVPSDPTSATAPMRVAAVLVLSEVPLKGKPVFAHPAFPRVGMSDDDFESFLRGQGLASS